MMARLVLVIDDDPMSRRSLATILELEGYEIEEAADGREALALLDRGLRPDVMLMDMRMPKMGGDELLRRMDGVPALSSIPVIVASAELDSIVDRDARIVAMLRKPYDLVALLDVLDASLQGGSQDP